MSSGVRVSFVQQIADDIAAFADAGTTVKIAEVEARPQVTFQLRGVERQVYLTPENRLIYDGQTYTYREFLASSDLADLRGFAAALVRTSTAPDTYLEPYAEVLDETEDSREVEAALTVLRKTVLGASEPGRTQVVFVTADAGVGKTTTLRELVRIQATDYIQGAANFVYLYIDAQGRALARFNEAMAIELQDLRTRMTYHAMVPLVREGLVIPVVDGFDELIGSQGGYDDAFNSLASFLEQLDGHGTLIAAARSVYYEQEFVNRANTRSALGTQSWIQTPLLLHEWDDGQVENYVRRSSENDEAVLGKVRALLAPESVRDLRGRPLFVTRVTDLVKSGDGVLHGDSLLDSLVAAYLRREQSRKLLNRSGQPLISEAALYSYYSEIALEMWRQETRELDSESLREIAALFAAVEDLGDDAQRILSERAPTLAFMHSGSRPGSVKFEHETFFFFFMSRPFALSWVGGGVQSLRQLIAKSLVTQEMADYTARQISKDLSFMTLVEILRSASSGRIIHVARVKQNVGTLLASLFHYRGIVSEMYLEDINFVDVDLSGVEFSACKFSSCGFHKVLMRNTVFRACSSERSFFQEIEVFPTTILDIRGAIWDRDFFGLRAAHQGGFKAVYEPLTARYLLTIMRLPSAMAVPANEVFRLADTEVVRLIEQFSRACERANPLCHTDRMMKDVVASKFWPRVRSALIDCELVTPERRSTSGSATIFYRTHFAPMELLDGFWRDIKVRDSVRQFWNIVESEFPKENVDLSVEIDAQGKIGGFLWTPPAGSD